MPDAIRPPVLPHPLTLAQAICAVVLPTLLAYNLSPSATYLNQALALFGWGIFLLGVLSHATASMAWRQVGPMTMALVVLLGSVFFSIGWAAWPASLAWSAAGMLAAALLVLLSATLLASSEEIASRRVYAAFCMALVLAGAGSLLIALIQYFAPGMVNGTWIAHAGAEGRVGGNLRQPNHLSSLLLMSFVAALWLHETCFEESDREAGQSRSARAGTALLLLGFIFGVVLTASRTGAVCIVLLAIWGGLDRRLSRFSRSVLWITPIAYLLFWVLASEWAHMGHQSFVGEAQLHKSDLSSSRFAIWANTLSLIAEHPWLGVGWGDFNFAWTLTPFPGRPVAFFDHTHNVVLNFLVELGVPLGTLVLVLLAVALWQAFRACLVPSRPISRMARASFMLVLMMAVHSLLEYPLWYSYFLLPTVFAFGICLGSGAERTSAAASAAALTGGWQRLLAGGAAVLMIGTVVSLSDYLRVASIFTADESDAMPLSERIARGQKSIFFAHHADYAAATVATQPSEAWSAFRRAPHLLLDTRLMMAWAKAYAEKGDIERARYIADRLREFHNADSDEFFAECNKPVPAGEPEPFQCKPATRQFTYEDFKLR